MGGLLRPLFRKQAFHVIGLTVYNLITSVSFHSKFINSIFIYLFNVCFSFIPSFSLSCSLEKHDKYFIFK